MPIASVSTFGVSSPPQIPIISSLAKFFINYGPNIVLVDHTGEFTHTDLTRVAKALQKQVNRDFSKAPPLGYGMSCNIRVATPKAPAKANEWEVGLFNEPDISGALGYHYQTDFGLPLMKVFPFLDNTLPWTVTASHEILETLVDPNICKAAQSPFDGRFWAYEVCDAVEMDTYDIDGVTVSNFVTPAYFEPPERWWDAMKLDHMGLVKRPAEIRPGGYGQYWNATNGWVSVYSSSARPMRLHLAEKHGRGYIRRTRDIGK